MSATSAAEASVAAMVGKEFSAEDTADKFAGRPRDKFDFDESFQSKVAAFACRDEEFMRRMSHLLRPEYFENIGEGVLVNISLQHYQRYRSVPDTISVAQAIKDGVASKTIRREILPAIIAARAELSNHDLLDREYVEDKIVAFARHQEMSQAIWQSVELLDRKKFDSILTLMQSAINIGANEDGNAYDYFAEIENRTKNRLDALAGILPPQGITTGNFKLDELLYHRGWGRRELTSIMGSAKSGKTTALIGFSQAASLAGHNVLYVTLEVGASIIGDRMDASLSETMMKDLATKIHGVKERVEEAKRKSGRLIIHEYPSGSLSPDMLEKLIERYKSPSRNPDGTIRPVIKFDLIVVDYADIMKPNNHSDEARENLRTIYVDLRAIAFRENAAVLTATQANREGHKATVAKMEHVSDDFNKVRTVDLLLSINKTEEEASRGEARLYFAASRNQESGFTVVIKQNMAMMRFLESVLRIE